MKTNSKFLCTASLALILSACGGGGGGGGSVAVVTPPSTPLAPIAFTSITPAANFNWKVQPATATGVIQLTRQAGGAVGSVRVTISNFIETDPTGGGGAIPPMSTYVLGSANGDSATASTVLANFSGITYPSGTTQVLVEVFSLTDGTLQGSAKVNVSQLNAGTVSLVL